ncbi:MAG TPA: pitrilysin family protein [Methylomirabilota bacterium]|jgi:predicted Zn-dependent peptidase
MIRVAIALLLVVLAVPTSAGAADVVRERFDNGMVVLVRENPLAPVVALSLLVKSGVRWEKADVAGISNFLTAVMVKGTMKRGGAEMAEAIAALGGKITASGDVDYSEIRASALARYWREMLVLTAELALDPKLAADEVDRERELLVGRVQRRRDNAPSRAFDEFYRALYSPHPYGLPTLGTPETIARIDRAALVARYRAFWQPERMALAVSGQVSAPEVIAEARRLFAGLLRGNASVDAPIPPPAVAVHRVVLEQPAQQAQIVVGGVAPALDHPDHAAVKVLGSVLGGGMGGRLFAELRDRRGLAYAANTFYEPVREPGALILYLGTAPENVTAAEAALVAEIQRVRTTLVSAEELRRAKGYLLGAYESDRRTNARQAWYLAFYELAGVGLDYPERFRKAVAAVTAEDVRRVANQYLSSLTAVVLRPR